MPVYRYTSGPSHEFMLDGGHRAGEAFAAVEPVEPAEQVGGVEVIGAGVEGVRLFRPRPAMRIDPRLMESRSRAHRCAWVVGMWPLACKVTARSSATQQPIFEIV